MPPIDTVLQWILTIAGIGGAGTLLYYIPTLRRMRLDDSHRKAETSQLELGVLADITKTQGAHLQSFVARDPEFFDILSFSHKAVAEVSERQIRTADSMIHILESRLSSMTEEHQRELQEEQDEHTRRLEADTREFERRQEAKVAAFNRRKNSIENEISGLRKVIDESSQTLMELEDRFVEARRKWVSGSAGDTEDGSGS